MPSRLRLAMNADRRANQQAYSEAAIDFAYVGAYQGDTPKPPEMGGGLSTDEIECWRENVVAGMKIEAEF